MKSQSVDLGIGHLGLYLGHRITLKMNRQRFLQVLHGVLLVTGGSLVWRAI